MTIEIADFTVSISEDMLDDVRSRLARTRYPDDLDNADWSYGTNAAWLRAMVEYWRTDYDWRSQERAINAFRHRRTEIAGVPIHFVHAKGVGPAPMPLILSHGWPWTFWDMHRIIGPLSDPATHGGDPADAFEVIVPSMPGFGFSTPLRQTGVNFANTADLWNRLMTEGLGFDRYAAHGGDWGSLTTAQLGHKYADHLHGIHLSTMAPLYLFNHERPWDVTAGTMVPAGLPEDERARMIAWQQRIASHVAVQVLDPQTLSYGLHDSPAALLAWLAERRRSWGDCRDGLDAAFDRDFMITTTMLYWVTESFVTSARFYAEAARNPWQPSHDRTPMVEAPTGISQFPHDGTTGLGAGLDADFNVVQHREHDHGGHFAAYEAPEAIVTDIRDMFRAMR